jgi:predicted permease
MWGWNSVEVLLQDIRYGLRQFGRTPAFAVVAILTLALGIGATTAIFSAMNAILLRYFPVPNPQQLVYLSSPSTPAGAIQSGDGNTSMPERIFEELRSDRQVLSGLFAFVPLSFERIPVRYGAAPEEVQVDMVSGNFFSGLGVTAARGRTIGMEDESAHAPVAVLSYAFWTRRFGRDPSVLGQTLYVKGVPITIVGVAAPDFSGVEHSRPTEMWIPLQTNPTLGPWGVVSDGTMSLYGSPNWWCLKTMGRLAPGVTAQQAQARLNPAFQRAAYGTGAKPDQRRIVELRLIPARGLEGMDRRYRQPLAVLMSMVGLIMVIACANVALLLVARNAARRREFGLRMALGGNRGRLFRQLLTESLLLVTAGGLLGWLFAIAATRVLAVGWGLEFDLAPDRSVLLFTLAVSLGAALVFGLAPLRGVIRIQIGTALKASSANASQDRTGLRGSHVVVALQMSLCLVLLVGAGLLVRTLRNLETTALGIRTSGLLVFGINPTGLVRSDAEMHRFYRAMLNRLRALPGVESATVMGNRVGSGWSNNMGGYQVDGKNPLPDSYLRWNRVGPDYFHLLGIPVWVGRDIADSDTAYSPKVAVVNQAFVERFLPGREPLGHTIGMGKRMGEFSIVGVARNSKYTGVSEATTPTAYFPYTQTPGGSTLHVELRTAGNPLSWLTAVRHAVAEFGPDLALLQPMTQEEQFEKSFRQERLFGRFAMFFGVLAMLLVATGLYGTLASAVSRRTAEVGVRMALGAQRRQVLWLVLRGSLAVCLGSVAVGLPTAIASVRFLRSMLYGVEPADPVTFVAAVCGILMVALVASLIPARRAASVDPVAALRHD